MFHPALKGTVTFYYSLMANAPREQIKLPEHLSKVICSLVLGEGYRVSHRKQLDTQFTHTAWTCLLGGGGGRPPRALQAGGDGIKIRSNFICYYICVLAQQGTINLCLTIMSRGVIT